MQSAQRILVAQTVVGMCAAALWGLKGWDAARAAGCGAAVAVLPGIYLAWRMAVARRISGHPGVLVASVYRGAAGKLALSAVLFALAVSLFPGEILPVMTTFIACAAVYWLSMLVPDNEGKTTNDGERTR